VTSARPAAAVERIHPYRGYLYIACSAVLWGISASLGRAAFTGKLLPSSGISRVDPLILSQARTTFSFLAVLVGLVITRGLARLRMPWSDLGRAAALGLAGVAASNYFYYLAIQRTNVATAIIIQYTAPIWVLLYMVLRKLERATLPKMIAVALAIFGIAFVIGVFGQGQLRLDSVGVAAAVVAAFSFSFYNILGHSILARYDRWTVLLFTTLSASVFWIFLNSPWKIAAAHYTGVAWGFLFLFSLLSVLLPFTFYFAGLQHLSPTKAIVVSCLEPVFTILIAAAALHESVRPLQAIGMGMVLSAIMVVQRPVAGDKTQLMEPVD
jgi:drug/metabolite transporter (DMT)-like permease